MKELLDLTEEDIQLLPIDQLGLIVLKFLKNKKQSNSHNFLNEGRHQGKSTKVLTYWSEGLNWLVSKNLVARGTPNVMDSESIFLTRIGEQVLNEGYENIKIAEKIDMPIHERLKKVRSQFLLGEYELAAFAAMREVEIRVRDISGADPSLIGVKLMRKSFGEEGKLAVPDLDPGERIGIMELFAGAIGTFKNPSSHRQVDYSDSTEALEVILLADLLMRLLDRVEKRLKIASE